jgi:deoxycytidylate deaminase
VTDKERIWTYKCRGCKTPIGRFLIGGSNESGKLLDICRALHAEEQAIIGLAGRLQPMRSAKHDIDCASPHGKLVLYTTTYPCNLCANKIVAAGIEEVWYAEPYDMEDARKILDGGGVGVFKFQGVKSTAYFRLYS